jgi:hypothetical protein
MAVLPPRNHDEITFALIISDLVNPPDPKAKGRKPESSPNQHHLDHIEPLYFTYRQAGESKNSAAKKALDHLRLQILTPSSEQEAGQFDYVAADERSALNSIVSAMNKRESAQRSVTHVNSI